MSLAPLARRGRLALAALALAALAPLASAASPAVAQAPPDRPTPRISQQPIGNLRLTVAGATPPTLGPMPLVGFAIAVEQPATIGSAGGGAGAGKATFEEAVVVKSIDETTPELFRLLATGAVIQSVEINLCRSGSDCTSATALVSYTLDTASLTELADTGGTPSTEQLSFEYGALTIRTGQTSRCWDRVTNTACATAP